MAVTGNTCPGELEVGAGCLRFKREHLLAWNQCRAVPLSHVSRCVGRRAAISFRAAERIWKSFCWGKRITPAKPSYASVTALFWFCKPHIDLSVKNNCIVKALKWTHCFITYMSSFCNFLKSKTLSSIFGMRSGMRCTFRFFCYLG